MAVLGFGLVLKTSLSVILILIGTDTVLSLPTDSDDRLLRGGVRLNDKRRLPIESSLSDRSKSLSMIVIILL